MATDRTMTCRAGEKWIEGFGSKGEWRGIQRAERGHTHLALLSLVGLLVERWRVAGHAELAQSLWYHRDLVPRHAEHLERKEPRKIVWHGPDLVEAEVEVPKRGEDPPPVWETAGGGRQFKNTMRHSHCMLCLACPLGHETSKCRWSQMLIVRDPWIEKGARRAREGRTW